MLALDPDTLIHFDMPQLNESQMDSLRNFGYRIGRKFHMFYSIERNKFYIVRIK